MHAAAAARASRLAAARAGGAAAPAPLLARPLSSLPSPSKIVAVAKNYAAHAAELAHHDRAPPPKGAVVWFLKPPSSVVRGPGAAVAVPAGVEVHHEVELGVVIGTRVRGGAAGAAAAGGPAWENIVAGYVLGLDMTDRAGQAAAKAAGLPWSAAKGWDSFTPLGPLVPRAAVADAHDVDLELDVDGEPRQRGSTADMTHRIPAILAAVARVMTLEPGDVVLTGTPAGVGRVLPGQTITARASCRGTLLARLVVPVVAAPAE